MPDLGAPRPASPASAPHVSTSEWQSFEGRMRHRRAERCVARAEEALAEGRDDEAAEALAEAGRLAPAETPDLATLRARVASSRISAGAVHPLEIPDIDTLRAHVAATQVPAEVAQPLTTNRSWTVAAMLAAMLVIALGLGVVWFAGPPRIEGIQMSSSGPEPAPSEPPPAAPRVEVPPPAAPPLPPEPAVEMPASATPPPEPADRAEQAAVARSEATPRAQDAASVLTRTPESQRALPAPERPVRTAFTPPPPTVGTAGAGDLPLVATSTLEVPVAPPPAPATTPPSQPTTPADNAAAGVTVPTRSDPKPPVTPPAAPERIAPPVEPKIRAVLSSYEAAFRALDAAAVQRIWPGVDERALARAFEGLASQSVSLGNCAFAITGTSATAQCTGSATWTPKVGSGSRTVSRRWQFALQNAGDDWQIVRAEVR